MKAELVPAPRSQHRARRPWIVTGLAALSVAALIWWHPWSGSQAQTSARAAFAQVPTVRIAKARAGDMPVTFDALGTVTPLANVTVRTQIGGQLMALGFHEGQMVAKGDFLAQVDPRPYQVALEQDEGQLARDQALLQQARNDLARYRTLASQDSIARQQVDNQESLVQQYEGAVKSDQGLVDGARLNLAYCHIVAPVAGRVGLRQVDQGNYVQTGDTNGIVVLTQVQPISVIFTLPEDDLPAILAAMQGGQALDVAAFDRSNANLLGHGKLTALDNQVDPATGTVKLRAEFENADGALYPNQFVNARLTVKTLHDAVLVPSAALLTGAPGSFVYRLADDHTVAVQKVTPGPATGEVTSITEGLSPGDQVVIDGTDRLKDGASVAVASGDGVTGTGNAPGKSGWSHEHDRQHPQTGQPAHD
jgi:membrane fusion protein, multidrug efflux system